MATSEEFQTVFKRLRAILEPYAARLVVVHDTDSQYYLNTKLVMSNKQPLFFGAVRIGKAYVSFHLMPVYAHPTLMREIPAELKNECKANPALTSSRSMKKSLPNSRS